MPGPEPTPGPRPSRGKPVNGTGTTEQEAQEVRAGRPAPHKAAEPDADGGDGSADDLTQISGIGPKIRDKLHGIGVRRFSQIAAWTEEDIDRIDAMVGGPDDRVRRDEWVAQARRLAAKGETDG
jgi:NADH-quinone oxidoreductase subunit E